MDESFTKISESQLLKVPGMQPLRRELLQSALAFNEEFLKEHGDDPNVRAGLASAFLRVGKIRTEFRESAEAKKSFEKARALFEPLVTANPSEPELAHGLAESLYRLGRNEEAIPIWKRLVQPGNARFQRELADAYNGLASEKDQVNKLKVLDAYQKSLAIREMLVALNPDDPLGRRDLGASLNNIGVLLEGIGQREQALPLYRRGAEQAEKAFAQVPQDLRNGRFLASMLENCARVEEALGHPDEAIVLERRIIAVWKAMARDNPAISWIRLELLNAYPSLVQSLRAGATPMRPGRRSAWRARRSSGSLASMPTT